jgi:hypothetical protein
VADYEPKNLDPLLALFNVRSKSEAERHCRSLVIHGSDLAAVVTASRVGALHPYKYACRFDEKWPQHLNPKGSELEAKLEVGPLKGEAKKLFRKLFQTLEERRVFAAHLLYTIDHAYWHVLYFDQHDVSDRKNHWEHGSHIHYANDTFHRGALEDVWGRVCEGDTAFLKPLHIRFQQ